MSGLDDERVARAIAAATTPVNSTGNSRRSVRRFCVNKPKKCAGFESFLHRLNENDVAYNHP